MIIASVTSSMCASEDTVIKVSENLSITKLNERSYIHTSYATLKDGTKFPCNGFIYVVNKKAIVFDTPITNTISEELITWIESDLGAAIKSIFISHFHKDAAGGLSAFKKRGITSYAHTATTDKLWDMKKTLPDNSFPRQLKLLHEKMEVLNIHLGPGHSPDNIVTYFANENILFAGCLVKELGAEQGNIKDANLEQWAHTVAKVQASFPNTKIVVPGHGAHGGQELLTYTQELFKSEVISQN